MNISGLENAAHLGNGTISKWKKQIPQVDNLYSVAKVLETSMESILTGNLESSQNNRKDSEYSDEDLAFVEKYRKLDDCEKQIILGKISEFIYNKKMEESSEKLSPKVLWDLLADPDNKNSVVKKQDD
jgi:hypothetical protein